MTAAVYLNEATKIYEEPSLPGWTLKPARSARSLSASVAALDRVSFRVEPAEIIGVVGDAGAGKTTLIQVLAGRLPLDSGEARVFGLDVTRQRLEVARLTNRVSVEASFFKSLSPLQNLLLDAAATSPSEDGLSAEIAGLLSRLGLDSRRQNQPMDVLGRNEHQLVYVARAVLSRAKLLLLDEPFAGLDLIARYRVAEALRELRSAAGATILFTARTTVDAEMLADRSVLLAAGRLSPEAAAVGAPLWRTPSETCVVDA